MGIVSCKSKVTILVWPFALFTMNLPNMDLADFQMLAALANASAAAQQQQQAAAAFASLTAQQQQQTAYSRQSTPPISATNSTKVSANNTRTPTPTPNGIPQSLSAAAASNSGSGAGALDPQSQSKYQQLLSVIEEMSKDIRPTYAGSKSSAEPLNEESFTHGSLSVIALWKQNV